MFPVVITIVIGVVVAFGLAVGGREDQPPLFAEDLRAATVVIGQKAEVLGAVINQIDSARREELDTATEELLTAIQATREQIQLAPADDPQLAGPLAVLGQALDFWEQGSTFFRTTVFRAADEQTAVGLEIDLTDALIDMRAGDRVYVKFTQAIAAAKVTQPVSAFPSIALVPDNLVLATAALQIVGAAQTPGNLLELKAELALDQVATVPEMKLNADDELVVTVTDTLSVQVVVFNRGNTDSQAIAVQLTMLGADGTAYDQSSPVPVLPAGGSTTVDFTDISVTPGQTYQMSVALPVADGEQVSEDNVRDISFRVNEATPTTSTGG
jgi:hypothetical protein